MKCRIVAIGITCGIIVASLTGCKPLMGVGYFGPEEVRETVVTDKQIDTSGNKENGVQSHYMVYTEVGVFEVDNSFMLGIYNADEIYAKLVKGKKYRITTKGTKVANFFYQEYPYVTKVEPINE